MDNVHHSWDVLCLLEGNFAPWSVEDIGAAFVVTESAGQKLAYVYFEDEPGRRSAAKLLTKDDGTADRGEYRQAARA